MIALPADTPVTTPVLLFTVATPGLLLLHTPPFGLLLKAILLPEQTLLYPVIGSTTG